MQAGLWRWAAAAALVAGLLLLWTLPGMAAQAVPAVRIGVVNMQQVLNSSQRGMAAKQKLDQERAARQKELDGRQQEVVKMQADLEKQAPVLSEQAKREKTEQLQNKVRDIRRLAEDANREFQKKLQDAEGEMTQDIIQVIQEYGKDQGYTIILERSMLPYAASAVDITNDIIKRFDGKQK
jgi:outer membrane protein